MFRRARPGGTNAGISVDGEVLLASMSDDLRDMHSAGVGWLVRWLWWPRYHCWKGLIAMEGVEIGRRLTILC